jgi:hypothetical protein
MKPLARLGITVAFCLCLLGWSGSHSALLAQNVQVTSATPPAAAQGTVNLNVVIGGNGFKKGAQAQWFVSGTTNPGGVLVNSTAFNSSSKLTANITVADTADIASFDVMVYSSGRTGKGTGLFQVTQKGTPTGCTTLEILGAIADTDTSNSNQPFQLQSDTHSYTTSTSEKVTSQIQSVGCGGQEQLFLDTSNSTTRFEYLTLADPASGSSSPFAGGSRFQVHATIISRCGENSENNGFTFSNMSPTQTLACALSTAFTYGGKNYVLKMNPITWPGSTWIQAACTGTNIQSGACNAWTLSTPSSITIPNGTEYQLGLNGRTSQTSAVGNLYQVANGNKTTLIGQYFVALSVAMTNP